MPTRNPGEPAVPQPAVAIAREWADVQVTRVDLSMERGPSAPPRARVQACVELGGRLLPADVRVELVTTAERGAASVPLRLWSSRSYQNGSFLFEALATADRLAGASDLSLRVVPSGSAEAEVTPVIARIAWPDDVAPRG